MRVKCIDNKNGNGNVYHLTVGKEYEVIMVYLDNCFEIENDLGGHFIYEKTYFEIIEEENGMKEFLNEYKRKFIDLTDEEKLLIIKEKMKGNVELIRAGNDMWIVADKAAITFNTIYRTTPKPVKKLDMPWQFIKPEFKWAAMDKDGEIHLHEEKPECGYDYFYSSNYSSLVYILNIDTTGVDWKTSLTQRPEGV